MKLVNEEVHGVQPGLSWKQRLIQQDSLKFEGNTRAVVNTIMICEAIKRIVCTTQTIEVTEKNKIEIQEIKQTNFLE